MRAGITSYRSLCSWFDSAKNSNLRLLYLLLGNGVNVNQSRADGKSALTLAAENGHEQVVKLLLDMGAYIEQLNLDGERALTAAAANGHEQVVKLLQGWGSSIERRNLGGRTASKVMTNKHGQVAKLLSWRDDSNLKRAKL